MFITMPPYGSMGILSLLCVFCLLVCTVTDFSAVEKVSGMKLCMLLRSLSGMSFSHFGELWLACSHGGSITSGMSYTHRAWENAYIQIASGKKNFAAKVAGQSEFGATPLHKAVWWDLRLASLLTHLL